MNSIEIWGGLAHVKPRPGNDLLDGAEGAFVPVVALAENDSDFATSVATLLDAYEFDVLSVENIDLLDRHLQRNGVDNEIIELAENLSPESPKKFRRLTGVVLVGAYGAVTIPAQT